MELLIKRLYKKDNYTIGKLYIDGVLFCDTLEDKDRSLSDDDAVSDIQMKKVYGETAIPTGMYSVVLSYSPKFKRILPEIQNVKGFSGIRIHSGNYCGKETFLKEIEIPKDKNVLNTTEYLEVF